MPKIYILKYNDPNFTGFVHGVQFVKGIGSTCSEIDASWLLTDHGIAPGRESKKGKIKKHVACMDITEEFMKKKKQQEAIAKARAAKGKKAEEKEKETDEE